MCAARRCMTGVLLGAIFYVGFVRGAGMPRRADAQFDCMPDYSYIYDDLYPCAIGSTRGYDECPTYCDDLSTADL